MPSKFLRSFFLCVLTACFIATALSAQSSKETSAFRGAPVRSALASPAIEKKVDALLRQMTLEEKVGQLVQYSVGSPTGPGTGRGGYSEMVAKGEVGCLYNLESLKALNQFQHDAVEKSRLHIPLLFGLDVIHGYRTTFPVPLGLASTWDPQIVEAASRLAAQEASAAGVRWTFSPMVDIARDLRWGRIVEGAGEDPFLGSAMARAYVRGYQGKRLDAPDSIAACAKHYVGYGAAEAGRDYNTTEISEHNLREVYLPPFYAALDEGGASVMSAFNSLNSVPASANPFTLTEVLRNEWKFPGIVDSDWTSIAELIPHGIANDGKTAAWKAFTAGVDMDMESNLYHEHLADLVKSGKVTPAQLDEAVRRILRVKFALGLFDKPYTDESRENHGALPAESLQLARTAAERSFVLLKNDYIASRRVLPLASDLPTVALIGPLADDAASMLGAWAARGNPRDVVTLKVALTQNLGAEHIKYAQGGEFLAASDAQIEEAVAAARTSDVAILALGEFTQEMTGEAGSRAHPVLPSRQEELLEKVAATGKPVVLLLFTGRPLVLPWAFAHVPAVLELWSPGVQAGPAIVRTLFGEVTPSGRLTVTWPRAVGQIPIYYNALNTGRPPGNRDLTRPPKDAGERYASRYIDELNAPQFPFGYGLSYTDFSYGAPEISAKQLSAKNLNAELRKNSADAKPVLTVTANVSNTGKTAADEVVQLYVRLQGTSVAEPVRKLKGFQRVALAPGETKKVTFPLGADSLALWDIRNEYTVEPSLVRIWVSPDSSRGEAVALEITD
ncbi:MAG: beta-glucosidase BglX [Candidatus Acidiferrales bacterium]